MSISNIQSPVTLLVAIPLVFPDSFPAIYLPKATVETIGSIPHLDKKRFICTFDTQRTRLNDDRPGDIVLEVIERAVEIWQAGVDRTNLSEYEEEFLAYWDQEVKTRALSIVQIEGVAREIVCYPLSPLLNHSIWLFADNRDDAKKWLRNIGYRRSFKQSPALYLPITSLGDPPFPKTNGEICAQLRESDPSALETLLNFLSSNDRPSRILFSIPTKNGGVVGAWSHPPIYHHSSQRGRKTVKDNIRGFRPGKHPIKLEMLNQNRNAELTLTAVTRAERQRLIQRTAGTEQLETNSHVNIIGCGSVGGFTAESIVRSGLSSRLRLVDNDVLSAENIWRHYCGMSDIGKPKVGAVGEKLSRHFPDIDVKSYGNDVLELLSKKNHTLVPASLTISTTGHFSMESRLNRMFFDHSLGEGALCFIWVEPYLYAGHVLLLFTDSSGCYECLLDKNLLFTHRVLKDPGIFTRREAGCQSSFMPYSGVELGEFISQAMRFVRSNLSQKQNLLYSWGGDIEKARADGAEISPAWSNAKSYEQRTVKVNRSKECQVCPLH